MELQLSPLVTSSLVNNSWLYLPQTPNKILLCFTGGTGAEANIGNLDEMEDRVSDYITKEEQMANRRESHLGRRHRPP